MALTPNFSTAQIIGLPQNIVFVDESTGSDVAITERRILLQQYNGDYLVPSGTLTNYIVWPLGVSSSIMIQDVLPVDMALNITVLWVNISGTTLYSKTELTVFTMYEEMFDDQLITAQQADPLIVNNTNYYLNRIKLRVAINDAKNSILLMSSIVNSQQACNRGTYLIDNANMFY